MVAVPPRRLKHLASIRTSSVDKKATEGEVEIRLCNYTDVYYNDSIDSTLDFMPATATAAQVERFGLRLGDVVITKDSETADDIAIPALVTEALPDVVCGYHLALLRPDTEEVHPRYLFWSLNSDYVRQQFAVGATGVTRYGLRGDVIGTVAIPLPGLDDQLRIAAFLDRETARIDALVEKKRRLIDLLEEHHAAWRDSLLVDRNDVQLTPLRHLTDRERPIVYGIVQAGPDVQGGVPYIKSGDVARLDPDSLSRTSFEIDAKYARSRVLPGDIVVSMRASIGQAVTVPRDLPAANLTQGTARVAPDSGISGRWLLNVLGTRFVQEQFQARSVGSTYRTLNIWDLRRVLIPTPPEAVQEDLGRTVASARSALDTTSDALARQVDFLAEHRKAVITAAVTGGLRIEELSAAESYEAAMS